MCQSRTGDPSFNRTDPRSLTIAFHPPPLTPKTWAAGRTRALSEIDETTPGVLDIIQTCLIATLNPAMILPRFLHPRIQVQPARQSAFLLHDVVQV